MVTLPIIMDKCSQNYEYCIRISITFSLFPSRKTKCLLKLLWGERNIKVANYLISLETLQWQCLETGLVSLPWSRGIVLSTSYSYQMSVSDIYRHQPFRFSFANLIFLFNIYIKLPLSLYPQWPREMLCSVLYCFRPEAFLLVDVVAKDMRYLARQFKSHKLQITWSLQVFQLWSIPSLKEWSGGSISTVLSCPGKVSWQELERWLIVSSSYTHRY